MFTESLRKSVRLHFLSAQGLFLFHGPIRLGVPNGRTIVPRGWWSFDPAHQVFPVDWSAPDCDIRIDQSFVSNRHCALMWNGSTWVAEDLASRNGTHVNNIRIKKQPLKSGDTVTISKKVRYVIEFDPAIESIRFADISLDEEQRLLGDDRSFTEHGPATRRLEPHDKDVWSTLED